MRPAPMKTQGATKGIETGSLQQFEAQAKAEYLAAVQECTDCYECPTLGKLMGKMKNVAREHPELGPDALWERAKQIYPGVIWGFVQTRMRAS